MLRSASTLCVCVLASAGAGLAQGANPAPGLRLFGPMRGTDTHLVDTHGNIVHTWRSSFRPGLGVRMLPDGSLLRTIFTRGIPGTLGSAGGGVQRLAFDGEVLWDYRYDGPGVLSHHDVAPLPNGNILLVAWEDKEVAEAVAAGRDPARIVGPVFRPDHVIEVQPTGPTSGAIVWEWHVWDHLIQDFDPTRANFGVVADHPELVDINHPIEGAVAGDWNHSNGLDYDPVHDWIVLSVFRQNEIWIIDHSTTTAEAAGHVRGTHGVGGDLLYRWGNPAVYQRGTAAEQKLVGQHAPTFIPPGYPGEGHLILYNNRPPGGSMALELVLPLDAAGRFVLPAGGTYGPLAPTWSVLTRAASRIVSSAKRLPNGNTLICNGQSGLLDEITPAGQVVWTVEAGTSVFHAHYVERTLWADAATLSLTTGGAVAFDLVAGTEHAGRPYLVLGSASGTTPGTVIRGRTLPLNLDSYFFLTLSLPNQPPFSSTLGTLDAFGRARAGFALPPGLTALVGLQLDHAYAVFDAGTGAVTHTSNAVPLVLEL